VTTPEFGPWIVERPIGRGAHATVYRCHHQADPSRTAAVKVLHGAEHMPRQVARLAREARILRRLDHPGIVRVLDADTTVAEPWVALELVDGVPLDRARPGVRPPEEVALLAEQVAGALLHAHRVGVFHRDVKPANLLVERTSGQVRIVDFGISAALGESTLTDPGATAPGTVDYAPPEWFRSLPHELDGARLDAYALGVVLYEQLTGTRPFGGSGGLAQLLAAKQKAPFLDPGPGTPAALRELVQVITAADPRARATLEDAASAASAGHAPPERREFIVVTPPADAFVGRERALAELLALPPSVRLVTLVGPPGVGKSRLAQEWCRTSGSTPWVELGEVNELAGALRAAGRALGCAPALDAVTAALREGTWRAVLLDDADQVLEPLREVLPLAFRGTPDVRWVVTSRRRLRISGERVVLVEPLAVPMGDERTAATTLLRARVVGQGGTPPGDDEAARRVRAVDGLPLAIELAAAGPVGSGDGEDGLSSVLSAAWDRLDAEEQRVLAGCSVFRAPFGLTVAEDVLGAGSRPLFEVLQGLVDQSWLQVRRGLGAFAMLRTLRAFAERQLTGPVGEEVRLRHAFAAARPADTSRAPSPGDVDNALTAWDYAEAVSDRDLAVTLALVVALGSGSPRGQWAERARALLASGAGSPDDRARLLERLG
jgi:hypothetical protein